MIGIMNNLSGILNIACAISVQFPFFNADYDVKLVNRTDAWRRNGGMSCQIYMLSLSIYIIIIIIIILILIIIIVIPTTIITTTIIMIIIITIITIIIAIIIAIITHTHAYIYKCHIILYS